MNRAFVKSLEDSMSTARDMIDLPYMQVILHYAEVIHALYCAMNPTDLPRQLVFRHVLEDLYLKAEQIGTLKDDGAPLGGWLLAVLEDYDREHGLP